MCRGRSVVVAVVLCGIAFRSAGSQQQQAATRTAQQFAHADSAFLSGSWNAAADGYRVIVRDNPGSGMGWFRLAVSLERANQPDDAADAYRHASGAGFQKTLSEMGMARIFARKGSTREALGHLQAAATLGIDPSQLENEAFVPLRGTADFASLKKWAEEIRYPCRAVHTFDFWAGTFDAGQWSQPNGPSGGYLQVTREDEGCVFLERWTATAPGNAQLGTAMFFYDVARKKWRQVWNDDSNQVNEFEGTYHDGAMRMTGWIVDPSDGKSLLASNVLQDVAPGVIRHTFSTSADSGKTWIVRSDGRFVRRKD